MLIDVMRSEWPIQAKWVEPVLPRATMWYARGLDTRLMMRAASAENLDFDLFTVNRTFDLRDDLIQTLEEAGIGTGRFLAVSLWQQQPDWSWGTLAIRRGGLFETAQCSVPEFPPPESQYARRVTFDIENTEQGVHIEEVISANYRFAESLFRHRSPHLGRTRTGDAEVIGTIMKLWWIEQRPYYTNF